MGLDGWRRWMKDKSRRYRVEKWWWASHIPAATALFFFAPTLWQKVSILYLNLVSIYSLVITAGGASEAADAAAEAKSND